MNWIMRPNSLELEREAIIQHCLRKLKKDQRSALKLLYEKSHETTILAQRFGKSTTGFYQWIYRIRQKLSVRKKNDSTSLCELENEKEEELINRYLNENLNSMNFMNLINCFGKTKN